MRRIHFILLLAVCLSLGMSSCQKKVTKLYVATINDMHANIDNFPKLAYIIDSLRVEHPDMLLFSAGDNRSGNPFSDRYAEPSRPIIELMNTVGFDLCALGNHEWDDGPENLRQMTEWANFPFICANVTFEDSLNIKVAPYTIIERNGLKIGVVGGIGIMENGFPEFHLKNSNGSSFQPIEKVLPEYMGLREKCNALFLLSHCGFEKDVELAEQFPQFDAIFGGHSHTLVDSARFFNNVLITQAMNKVQYLTFSTFTFDRKGRMINRESVVIPIATCTSRDEKVQEMVDQFNDNAVFKEVLGYNDVAIEDCHECMGYLMADAHREAADADMAFQNYGGVRIDTLGARPILLKDLYSFDPFDNDLVSLTMTGQEIVDFLDVSLITDKGPNFCSGCTYTYALDAQGQMTDCQVLLDNGEELVMDKKYKVVMNSYMITNFLFAHEDPGVSDFCSSNEAVRKYLVNHPHVNYAGMTRVYQK